MAQETIIVDSVGPGGREMIPVPAEPTADSEAAAFVAEEPKKTRKKKTSE